MYDLMTLIGQNDRTIECSFCEETTLHFVFARNILKPRFCDRILVKGKVQPTSFSIWLVSVNMQVRLYVSMSVCSEAFQAAI